MENERERFDEEVPVGEEGEQGGGSTGGGFVTGLIVGALLGAGIALLLAPEDGVRTRRRVGHGMRELERVAAEGLGAASSRARRELRRRRKQQARLRRMLSDML